MIDDDTETRETILTLRIVTDTDTALPTEWDWSGLLAALDLSDDARILAAAAGGLQTTDPVTQLAAWHEKVRALRKKYDEVEEEYQRANDIADEEGRTVSSDDLWAHDDDLTEIAHEAMTLFAEIQGEDT